jgi:hypothetical protein
VSPPSEHSALEKQSAPERGDKRNAGTPETAQQQTQQQTLDYDTHKNGPDSALALSHTLFDEVQVTQGPEMPAQQQTHAHRPLLAAAPEQKRANITKRLAA